MFTELLTTIGALSAGAWMTLAVLVTVVVALVFTRFPPYQVFLGGLTMLLVTGVLEAKDALSGLSNPGMITVAVLFVVVAGLRDTGGIDWLARRVLGRPKSVFQAQMRIVGPVAGISAFLNNTPVVAMLIPAINEWAKNNRIAESKLFIPLSYAAICGGMCTLIGTSTNLIVAGLLVTDANLEWMKMFDITAVGLPCAAVGIIYLIIFGRKLLPDRPSVMSEFKDPREYTVEMLVQRNSPLVGQTIEKAGLRHLPGIYLMEIEREGHLLVAVSPTEQLHANDRLVMVGIIESVVDLQRIRGLVPAGDQIFKLDAPRSRRCLIEAVVSDSCPLLGKTIRDGRFRSVYDAVVVAVARNGERIERKIGDIVLRSGDTLLLEALPAFIDRQRNSRDFFLVSKLEGSAPPRHERAWIALIILAAMVLVASTGWLSMLKAAMVAAGLMVITRCATGRTARNTFDWQVLLTIAAALGIAKAMDRTGLAAAVAGTFIHLAGDNPWIVLAAVYGVTSLFTALITNNAAAVLMFPIAIATARDTLGINVMPFAIAVMIAASASFSTPIAYQTNLMVYGPGGYRFSDYLRIGVPLNLLMWVTTVAITPLVWPFK